MLPALAKKAPHSFDFLVDDGSDLKPELAPEVEKLLKPGGPRLAEGAR